MDSYSYNSYARYYDKNFPTDFQKSCNQSAALREDYEINFNRRFPLKVEPETKSKTESNSKTEPKTKELVVGIDSGIKSCLNLSPKVD
jgi:hypothetical protein